MSRRLLIAGWLAIWLALVATAQSSLAQDAPGDGDEPEDQPGIVLTLRSAAEPANAPTIARLAEQVRLRGKAIALDPRLPAGKVHATWRGRLAVLEPGKYRLYAYGSGHVVVHLAGTSVLNAESKSDDWLRGTAQPLEFGHAPFEVDYTSATDDAHLELYWSGPSFQLEPVSAWQLFREPGPSPVDRYAQGQLLAARFACTACHKNAGPKPIPAPSLVHVASTLRPEWLVSWLTADPAKKPDQTLRHHPRYDIKPNEAEAIAWSLIQHSQPLERPIAPAAGDAAKGERLLVTIGCLACHKSGELGTASTWGGGELSAIGKKHPPEFFAAWLEKPRTLVPDARMPVFPLSAAERADLATALATRGGVKPTSFHWSWETEPSDRQLAVKRVRNAEGERSIVKYRCNACHEIEGFKPLKVDPFDPAEVAGERSCASARPSTHNGNQPALGLEADEKAALADFFSTPGSSAPRAIDGAIVFEQHNCLQCHARGLQPGISGRLPAVIKAHSELAAELPRLAPPSLNEVGEKLPEAAMRAAIKLERPPLRPWLAVRMPKFDLSADELTALVEYLGAQDRLPPLPADLAPKPASAESADATSLAGSRLVTADGFGCTSCHQIGSRMPNNPSLAARGTNLTNLGERIRRPWFDRWVRNPARIVPRMEMPAIQQPVRGVLHDDVSQQLAAVWDALNRPGFEPPEPNPIRVLRTRNLPAGPDAPIALADTLELGGQTYVQSLVVGLGNRHNALVDFESGRFVAWWMGDCARQRTRGKQWHWEPGGNMVANFASSEPDVRLIRDGAKATLVPFGQFVAALDGYERDGTSEDIHYRLHSGDAMLRVTERWTSLAAADSQRGTGFRRMINVEGLPRGATLNIRVLAGKGVKQQADDADGLHEVALPGPARIRVRITKPTEQKLAIENDEAVLQGLQRSADGSTRCELEYLTDLPTDEFPVDPPGLPVRTAGELHVVPGFAAVRLPLSDDDMPTGLAWRADGSLVYCSLKGNVLVARDTDGDGLYDTRTVFAEGLSTPYGVALHGEAVDAITKTGLVRLIDTDGDGRADRIEVLADGWGHTDDYHDWAVGLPQAPDGTYYVALPCQQDKRSEAAAYLRGQALALEPIEPSTDLPRSFRVKPICAGLRFPMGLALSRDGELLATDNQGNYNPFNELNWLQKGKHYGFINAREVRPGYNPPLEAPAVNLPHPWTRSVNGIAFLDTPQALKAAGKSLFGSFEGQLIGCEFDTRRLIRMSLQRVGDVMQGATYPFSVTPEGPEETFEGPIVCGIAPSGDLYVGNLRDSGWGGGQNTGSIVRVRPQGELPCGIAEVRAESSGFAVRFTQPVEPTAAGRKESYKIEAFRRVSTPAYGGPDVDRHRVEVKTVNVAEDLRSVRLEIARWEPGMVYELHLPSLAAAGQPFFPSEAYYTLNVAPGDSPARQ